MKQHRIIRFSGLFLLLGVLFGLAACNDWTEMEAVDNNVKKPWEQDPALWAEYTAALRDYKKSEHFIVYARLHNSPEPAASEKDFMRCLPDSLDIVALTNKYINLGQQKFSLVRLAYQYPLFVVLIVLCVIITNVCVVLSMRARRFRDLTEAALHRAEEASTAKTEFLSNMSHDIRTPINGIMGMLDIAEENFEDQARVRDCLTKMRGAASHLLSLVNDVLDMSKIESGSMKLLNNPFDLRVLLQACCDIVEGQIIERKLTFSKQIGPFWHPYLVGSELHVRQVLINILSNAVKYTPDGGTIRFCAKETLYEEGLVHLRMEITDNGIGMSEEFLQHIFEPFTQEQRSSRTHYKGTGLGMAITKKLVDQMHGSLDVESEPGKGSTFIVRLSLPVDPTPHPVAAQQPAKQEETPTLAGLHLLLAEDNELNSEIAVTLLEAEGAKVTAVHYTIGTDTSPLNAYDYSKGSFAPLRAEADRDQRPRGGRGHAARRAPHLRCRPDGCHDARDERP